MTATTRWFSPLLRRPADYPEELPFLSNHGCVLSRSGAGESELLSVIWPASVTWPADFLRQPLERAAGSREAPPMPTMPTLPPGVTLEEFVGQFTPEGGTQRSRPSEEWLTWAQEAEQTHRTWVASSRLPDEVSTVFGLVCERSREAGWNEERVASRSWQDPPCTAWFEKGSRVRLVIATAAGVTLQEGLPGWEAVRDSA